MTVVTLPRRRRWSELHPALYHARIHQLRLERHLRDALGGVRFARRRPEAPQVPCARHQSLLRRRLGDSDPQLQENKIVNLRLAVASLDGVVVRPGETFSFWRCVGPPTAARGFIEGLQLSRGRVRTGIGGGLCQMANLLYWLALHSPLRVTERHHHSFDPFPDDRRVLPFGSGASVFYNYVDLRFHNGTDATFALKVWLTGKHLKGALLADREWPQAWSVFEREHAFRRDGDRTFRTNEIWRAVRDRRTGALLGEELLMRNLAEVKYAIPDDWLVGRQASSAGREAIRP